jgi:hypothetical protein
MWGAGPADEPLSGRLTQAFPALAAAQIKEEPLHGKVRGTLGRRIGHEVLDLDLIDRADVETARRQVLAQLQARGVSGQATVEVERGEHDVVRVRVEQREPAPDPATPSSARAEP